MAKVKANAETFRILALTSLANKDLDQARLEIRKALDLEPKWESLQFTAAIIEYFSALSKSELPDRVVPWPEPVDWSLVKRDDESIDRLRAAAKTFQELLADPAKSQDERGTLEVWYLATLLNDAARHEEATEYCRELLQRDPTNFGAVAWAVERHLEIDLVASEKALKERVALGSAKVPHILALITCQLADHRSADAQDILIQARPLFEEQKAGHLWKFWYAQALTVAGDIESALNAIPADDPDPGMRAARTLILRAVARKSGDFSTLIKHLEKSYEDTSDPNFVLEACKIKAYENQWAYIAERANLLVAEIATADAIRLSAIGSYNDGRFDVCLSLLDAGRKAFPNQKLPTELRRLRVQTLRRLGTLPTALLEAESLVEEEATVQNILALAQIYFEKGDFKQLAIISRRLSDREELSADQLLRLARLIQLEDRDLAIALWRRTVQMTLSPEDTSMAVSLGYQLGRDDEMQPLLGKMADHAVSGVGPVKVAKLEDLRSFIEERRLQGHKLFSAYQDGAAPVHLITEAANIPLVDLYHRLLEDNADNCDPLHEPSLFARYGGRSLAPGFPQPVPGWRLNLDITAVLLAEHFGIFAELTTIFKPVRFSAHLIPSLVGLRDRILHEQPSRVRAGEEILVLHDQGLIRTVDCILPSNYPNELLVQELGAEWVSIFEKARDDDGYLVDFLPLTKSDLSGPPSALPDHAATYIINCRSIVEALRQQGPLTQQAYLKALEDLGDEGTKSWNNTPAQGTTLYCDGTISSVLSRAGLLTVTCSRFTVNIDKRELERIKFEIRTYETRNSLALWITGLIDRLREGIDKGIFEIIPPINSNDDNLDDGQDSKNSVGGVITSCLTDLLRFPTVPEDVIWVDDRYVNAYSHRDGAPIITICEVLKVLVSSGVLKREDYFAKIASMRASNLKYIPIERDELLYQLNQGKIDRTSQMLVETRELMLLRRYIATCLFQVDTPQWPPMPQGSPNEHGELLFFVTLGRAITGALIELWKTSQPNDEFGREARSSWLIGYVFQEHMGLNNAKFQQRSEADYQYIIALRLADLVAASIGLDTRSESGTPSVRKMFLNWLDARILQKRFKANPYLISSVADVFKKTLFKLEDDFEKQYSRAAALSTLQKFFEDLPDSLRKELLQDTDFVNSIGLKSQVTIQFEGLVFGNSEFWRAVSRAFNTGEAVITSLAPRHDITFQSTIGRNDQLAVCFSDPVQKRRIIIDDDIVRLAQQSIATREDILRRNLHWFDSPPEVSLREIAKIAAIEDVERRLEEVNKWTGASASVYYATLEQSLMAAPKVNFDGLRPPTVQGLLRRLRLPSDVSTQESSRQLFETAAETILRDEGLETSIKRLWALPVPLPQILISVFGDLSQTERRNLIKRLLKATGSPVSRIHLLSLLAQCSQDTTAYRRLARRLIRNMVYTASSAEFDAFKAILEWVSNEFGHWDDLQALPSRLRLALVWSHAHMLFSILVSARAPVDWLRDRFTNITKHLPHELFYRDPNYWFDIAHPRQLNRANLLLSGLSYSLAEKGTELIDPEIRNALIDGAYQIVEGERILVISLLRDATLASDSLGSFLAGDQGQRFVPFLGSDTAKAVSREVLLDLTKNAIKNLQEQPDNFQSWTMIFATVGDMPPYAEIIDDLSIVLKQTNLGRMYEKDPKLGVYLLMATTAWSCNLRDREVEEHLKQETIKICQLQSQSGTSVTMDEVALLLLESALNLSRSTLVTDNVLPEFANLASGMVEAWPALTADFRPVVQRFVDELPISQARQLYPLLLRLRAG